jgi:hypothetical protein
MRLDPDVKSAVRLDVASTTVTYIGIAPIGVGDTNASWSIRRITTSGAVQSIQWADGNDKFDNVWSNRAALTYV